MDQWLWASWDSIWPNLVANVLWIPIAWIWNKTHKKQIQQMHQHHQVQVSTLHAKISALHNKLDNLSGREGADGSQGS